MVSTHHTGYFVSTVGSTHLVSVKIDSLTIKIPLSAADILLPFFTNVTTTSTITVCLGEPTVASGSLTVDI